MNDTLESQACNAMEMFYTAILDTKQKNTTSCNNVVLKTVMDNLYEAICHTYEVAKTPRTTEIMDEINKIKDELHA